LFGTKLDHIGLFIAIANAELRKFNSAIKHI